MKQKLLFIVKNENEASSHFRVFGYLPYLKNDFDVDIFFSEYNKKTVPKIFRSVIKRLRFLSLLVNAKNYDILFMQRPMSSDKSKSVFFESLLSKINKKIIFDFDDAIFIQNERKMKSLIELSKTVICGNQYLADFSNKYNKNTYIIPTSIDTNKFKPACGQRGDIVTIGWTGTSGNYVNFTNKLIDTLKQILQTYKNIKILFICDQKPPIYFDFDYDFIKWNSSTEVQDLQKIHIGLMPLVDSHWTRGKCGFKLIQYGSIGIPSIGSNVGVNREIILDGESGYIVNNDPEWLEILILLIKNNKKRSKMGQVARERIENFYSTKSQYEKLKNIIIT